MSKKVLVIVGLLIAFCSIIVFIFYQTIGIISLVFGSTLAIIGMILKKKGKRKW